MSPSLEQIQRFATERFGAVDRVAVLSNGGWSSAYAFRTEERELVLRIGQHRADFEKEAIAATWRSERLPIPEIVDLGDAFDGHYIVSHRHNGTKLADLDPSRVPAAVSALFGVLAAIRRVRLDGVGYGLWLAPECAAPARSWSEHLCSVVDRDETRLVDWRRKLSRHPRSEAAFRDGCEQLLAGAADVPSTRGLVHADLLLNHLVGDDDTITAVFDWGNALAGDPLYDVAWIVACIPWFPAVDRDHVLTLARRHFPDDDLDRLLPFYELHIALGSIQYCAFADDVAGLDLATAMLERLAARP